MARQAPRLLKFTGHDLEKYVAHLLGATINDGLGDGGVDIIIPRFGGAQVKCSTCKVMEFLRVALQRGKFIALIVGEPGTEAEMIASLRQFGAWFGQDIHDRQEWLTGVAKVRDTIRQRNQKRIEVK